MKPILCILGKHKWLHSSVFYPSIDARIVTKVEFTNDCMRCGKKVFAVYNYDPNTGAVLEDD